MKIRSLLLAAAAGSAMAGFAMHAYAQVTTPSAAAEAEGKLEDQRNAAHTNSVDHPYKPAHFAGSSGNVKLYEAYLNHPRHFLYVGLAGGSANHMFSTAHGGHGIVVLDADNKYEFIKRISWEVPAVEAEGPEVSGITASTATNMLYLSIRGRLDAYDLATDKLVWSQVYGGNNQIAARDGGPGECCERGWTSPDGKTLLVGANYNNWWYVIDAATGKQLGRIDAPESPLSHNMAVTPDGKTAFLGSLTPKVTVADVPSRKALRAIEFSDAVRPLTINHDGSRVYVNVNNLLGFEIGDGNTGKFLKRVEAPAEMWKAKWADPNQHFFGHGCPSHGIGVTPDESELWVVDNVNYGVLVYDMHGLDTPTYNPQKSFKTTYSAGWISMTNDGKTAYLASGDIVDVKSHTLIGQIKDEYGDVLGSEKFLNLTFQGHQLVEASNQFAVGIPAAVQARAAAEGKQARN